MRLIRSSALVMLVASFGAVAACTGGDGGGGDSRVGNGDLSTGSYEVSNVDVDSDACLIDPGGIDGAILDVEVSGSDLFIDPFEGTIEEGVFDVASSNSYDFSEDPFGTGARDCQIDIDATLSGFTTDEDAADVTYSFRVRVVSGSECSDAATDLDPELDFPCTSRASFSMVLVPEPTPEPGAVESGYYDFPNAALSPNGCGFTGPGFYEGYFGADVFATMFDIEVALSDFSLFYEVTGTDLYDFSSPGQFTLDFNDMVVATDNGMSMTYDCVVSGNIQYVGSIVSPTAFRLEDHYDYTGAGTECDAVATSAGLTAIPCSTVDATDAVLQ